MDIDVVITWVDGSNEEWLALRSRYNKEYSKKGVDARARRWRDMNNLQYLFRGIDECMSWVRKIYIVTPGHYPQWLRNDNPRLVLVNQNDIMPSKYLPTFNNCAVELFFHRIPGIAEHFIYLNDDMFPLRPLSPEDFFQEGLPCDTVGFSAIPAHYEDGQGVFGIAAYCTAIVAKHFNKDDIIKRDMSKLLDPRNGKALVKTLLLSPYKDITGFNEGLHAPYSYLKRTYEEVWDSCEDDLSDTCESKFRPHFGANHWLMRYWQICKGNYCVRNSSFSRFVDLQRIGDEKEAVKTILNRSARTICINDNYVDDESFQKASKLVNAALEARFPERSQFEN